MSAGGSSTATVGNFPIPLANARQARLTVDACLLDQDQRRLVELTIADHCRVRGWTHYTVNCRSNHVHVIVAGDRVPKEIRGAVQGLVHPPAQGVAAGTSPSTLRT